MRHPCEGGATGLGNGLGEGPTRAIPEAACTLVTTQALHADGGPGRRLTTRN